MEINQRLSAIAFLVNKTLIECKPSGEEAIDVLLQIAIKLFLTEYVIDKDSKEGFMQSVSNLYDSLEEHGNILNMINRGSDGMD